MNHISCCHLGTDPQLLQVLTFKIKLSFPVIFREKSACFLLCSNVEDDMSGTIANIYKSSSTS